MMVSYSISWLCAKVPKPNKTAKIMLKILFVIMIVFVLLILPSATALRFIYVQPYRQQIREKVNN